MTTHNIGSTLPVTDRAYPKFQVLGAVVVPNPVLVVDGFARPNSPTKNVLHYSAMLRNPLTCWIDNPGITAFVDPTVPGKRRRFPGSTGQIHAVVQCAETEVVPPYVPSSGFVAPIHPTLFHRRFSSVLNG